MGEELAGALDWKWGQNPFLTMAQISHRKGENSRFPRTRMGSVYVFVCVYVWDEVEESEAE